MFLFYVLNIFKNGDTIQRGTFFEWGHYLRTYGNCLYTPGAFRTGAGLGAVILLWPLPFEEAMGILDLAGTRPPAPVTFEKKKNVKC